MDTMMSRLGKACKRFHESVEEIQKVHINNKDELKRMKSLNNLKTDEFAFNDTRRSIDKYNMETEMYSSMDSSNFHKVINLLI